MRRLAILTRLFWTLLVLPAALPAAQPPGAETLRTVRVQLQWTHQFQFAGYYAALQQGYYRDFGLDVILTEFEPSLAPIDQLLGGRVEFAVADTGALLYRSAGAPIVALAAIFQNSPSILISRANDGIEQLSDLRNRRVTLPSGHMNAELMSMLQSVGVSRNDFESAPRSTSIEALVDGTTDAFNGYITNQPFFLEQAGIPHIVFSPADYGVEFYGDILITRESLLQSDLQMVKDFREASLRGWAYAVQNPESMIDLILEQYNTQQKSREHLLFEAQASIRLILPNVVPLGYMNLERWQRIEDIFNELGLLTEPVDMTRFIFELEQSESLLQVLYTYRYQIGSMLVTLLGLLLVVHIVRLRALVDERTKALQEAKQLAENEARTDPLTALPNRRHFLEELIRNISRAKRHNLPLCIISLDLDFFKAINDKYGHAAGDEALRHAGLVLKRNIRQGDLAARMGGEEFAIVCMDINIDETRFLAERLREDMEATDVVWDGDVFRVRVSVGIAAREYDDDTEQLLRKADLALYEAKSRGRNQVFQWGSQLSTHSD